MVLHEFHFLGFNADEKIRGTAHLALDRVLDRAPYGAYPVALLEKISTADNDLYRCAIEVYTRYGPFTARAEKDDPFAAVASVERALLQKLDSWNERRIKARETHMKVGLLQPA